MTRPAAGGGIARHTPLLYLATAQLALAVACAVTAWRPDWIAGFFYHPRMIAVVHSLTLGWISCSLIGLLYLAARRWNLRPGRFDFWVFVGFIAGGSGLASHFWIEEFNGMIWSAGLLALSVLLVAGRFAASVAVASIPGLVKLQLQLAWLNLIGTAFLGTLLGINKTSTVLPGYSLDNVFAHAHLAAIGWAFLGIAAVGHLALLERGAGIPLVGSGWAGALLAQVGAGAVFVHLLTGGPRPTVWGLVAFAGIALAAVAIAAHLGQALRGQALAAKILLAGAGVWLGIGAGLALAGGGSEGEAGLAPERVMAYGVAGLLGGLGQAVAGWTVLRCGMRHPRPLLAGFIALGWFGGVPLLVYGLMGGSFPLIRAGAGLLFLTVCGAARWIAVARPDREDSPAPEG